MLNWIDTNPGRIYLVATLLPLAAFTLLLLGGGVRSACRPYRRQGGFADSLYWICGGDKPLQTGAYLATVFMALSAVLGVTGLILTLTDTSDGPLREARWAERLTSWVCLGPDLPTPTEWSLKRDSDPTPPPPLALKLELGYRIDHLAAVVFAMVTVISTLIFLFSLGYMQDETEERVADHEVDRQTRRKPQSAEGHPPGSASEHHFQRRGRFGRFFLYLSLFCFSMLNLVIADNLFQVFVSWELVGICSFLLIGFYYERPSASTAANKAFIVNRVGDAGFLVGIMIAWTYLGTLNVQEMVARVRSPVADSHGVAQFPNQFIRANPTEPFSDGTPRYELPPRSEFGTGSHLVLMPLVPEEPSHFHSPGYGPHQDRDFAVPVTQNATTYGAIPYWLFVVMGVGIFLGCVGKSAQVPLHTWLPDAMEGPTPVSALIHAATMVAAGVYLVGRCFPLFAPEVLLLIAYIGAITLFMAATIAVVQTDIKRVLAYSTCSQLGFMMLALGVGGWVAGLLHLITHAFFKALLFLCSGSVIHGCHHEQDIRRMGGLRHKMPITAFTMLIGVLAIAGMPLLSGWYSKDQILAAALGYGLDHPRHILLMLLPMLTTGLTAFYMFRLWFLTFTGPARDAKLHDHAHESPPVMTIPLIVLAVFSIGVAWGWPLWNADASYLGEILKKSQPAAVDVDFAHEHETAHHAHLAAGGLALLLAVIGAGLAFHFFGRRQPTAEAMAASGGPGYRFLLNKWYFDEAYDAALVNPTVQLARAAAAADKRPTDAPPPPGEPELPPKRFDLLTLDGLLNTLGQAVAAAGRGLRTVQTGQLRVYMLALALTAVLLLGILTALSV
jgi:NADH-quinone oxidoreductase subunit L